MGDGMFCSHIIYITGRRLPRALGALRIFDGDDGDELRQWGDEYRTRNGARVAVLRLIAQSGGNSLAALWVSGASENGSRNWVIANVLPALVENGRLIASVVANHRPAGRIAVVDVATTPAVLALWPSTWRHRLPADGPEWVGELGSQTPGDPPTGEHVVMEALA
jgi:hypothetical protein